MGDLAGLPPMRTKVMGKTGLEVSIVAIGGGRVGWSKDRPIDDEIGMRTIWTALEAGTALIDTAPGYMQGRSERIIGRALRERPDLAEGVLVTTKIGHPVPEFDYSFDQTMRSVEFSIENLKRDHFPILYVHDPTLDDFDRVMGREPGEPGTLGALRKLKEQGVVDNIGVGINNPRVNEVFIETGEFDCSLVPECYSLMNQYGLKRIFPAAERYGMGIATAEALEKGFLALGVRPNIEHRDRQFSPESLANTKRIQDLCAHYGISLAAAAVQYPVRHPQVHTTIVGARTPEQARQNILAARERIPEDFWTEVQPLIRHWDLGAGDRPQTA